MSIIVRPATDAELTLVRDSWARSFAGKPRRDDADPFINAGRWGIAPGVWFAAHRSAIEKLLETADVLVAAHEAHADVALGWMCFDGATLHYLFTLKDARKKGVASRLLQAAPASFRASHMTADGKAFLAAVRRRTRRAA